MAILAGNGVIGAGSTSLSGGGGGGGRDFLDTVDVVVANGILESFRIRIDNATNCRLTLKVFRVNGSNYDFVGASQRVTSFTDDSIADITLDTPINVLTGDLICFHLKSGGNQNIRAIDNGGQTKFIGAGSDVIANIAQSAFDTTIPNSRALMYEANGTMSVSNNSILITTVENRFFKQTSGSATVTITGTYAGTPTIIQRSVDGGAFVTAIASPSSNAFSDSFSLATGEHSIVYRFSNDTTVNDTIANVVVGDVIVCAGQSNMSGRGTNNQTFTNNADGTTAYLFSNADAYRVLTDPFDNNASQVDAVSTDVNSTGSWVPRFANAWLANSNTPILFIPTARGGTSVQNWQKNDTSMLAGGLNLYQSMARRINAVGGATTVLYQQGERDVIDAVLTEKSVYATKLKQFADDILADFSVNTFIVPLHTITASGFATNTTTTGQIAIRQAQIDVSTANAHVKIGQALTDIDLSGGDGLHFKTNADLNTVGTRMFANYPNGITLNAPTIDLTQSDATPTVGETINLTTTLTNTNSVAWTKTGVAVLSATTGNSITATFSGAGAYSITATATGDDGTASDTVNGVSTVASTLTMTLTDIPDGNYQTRIINADTGALLAFKNVAWSDGTATELLADIAVGTNIEYYAIGETDGGLNKGVTV